MPSHEPNTLSIADWMKHLLPSNCIYSSPEQLPLIQYRCLWRRFTQPLSGEQQLTEGCPAVGPASALEAQAATSEKKHVGASFIREKLLSRSKHHVNLLENISPTYYSFPRHLGAIVILSSKLLSLGQHGQYIKGTHEHISRERSWIWVM